MELRFAGQGATWTTLPGNFKQHGYFVTGTGKRAGAASRLFIGATPHVSDSLCFGTLDSQPGGALPRPVSGAHARAVNTVRFPIQFLTQFISSVPNTARAGCDRRLGLLGTGKTFHPGDPYQVSQQGLLYDHSAP